MGKSIYQKKGKRDEDSFGDPFTYTGERTCL